jgi:hypothetical protein
LIPVRPEQKYGRKAPNTVDVAAVGSLSARNCLDVKRKRKTAHYENREFEKLCYEPGVVETLYFGALDSEDFYRIYDKAAERKHADPLAEVPTYWVRVERCVSGRCLPLNLRTLGGLLRNGATCDPLTD